MVEVEALQQTDPAFVHVMTPDASLKWHTFRLANHFFGNALVLNATNLYLALLIDIVSPQIIALFHIEAFSVRRYVERCYNHSARQSTNLITVATTARQ